MRFPTLILTLLFLLSLSPTSPVLQGTQETPTKPLYQPTGNEATLTGSIIANGEVPVARRIDMTADPVCVKLSVGRNELQDLLIKNQQVLNTFIYLKSGGPLESVRFEVPASEVVLEHKNCQYAPRVFGVRVGQSVSFVNSDPTIHNTHPTPKHNREWNMSQAAGGAAVARSFSRAEQFIPVKDNQHPWERAILGVFDHPFFAVSDEFGNYEIRGVPPGTYKLVAWHEKLGEQEMEITIVPGENRKIDFTFDVAKARSAME